MATPQEELTKVIEPPLEKRLLWENHRLRASNLELQIQNLHQRFLAEGVEANRLVAEMQKEIGEDYVPRLHPETGQLEFVRKETQ